MTFSPPAGSTIPNGASYSVGIETRGGRGDATVAVAFVRDDGVYSRCLFSLAIDGLEDGPGGASRSWTHRVGDINNDPLNFAVGQRINLVALVGPYKSTSMCGVTVIGAPGAPAIDPSQADARTDVTLNWLVGQ